MYNTINHEHNAKNQKLNEELYLKYSLQEIDSEILVKKYHHSSEKVQKLIRLILSERDFNRKEIAHMLV
ncbi:MAG: hypothetical protein EON51_07785 [Acinetobacter sp.]|nr:MAG: hypothetical protein EON51_07785 [Acinetobacter sp.]